MLRTATALSLVLFASHAHAVTFGNPLQVDLGPAGQNVQAGWEAWTIDTGLTTDPSHTRAFADFGGFTASLDVADSNTSSNHSPTVQSFDPNLDLVIEDTIVEGSGSNGDEVIFLTLTGLAAGTYQMTTYHHRSDRDSPRADIAIEVEDVLVESGLEQSQDNSSAIASSTFTFVSNGIDDVDIDFILETASSGSSEVYFSGFQLSAAVPEPATLSLLLAGLGWMAIGRRRTRR